MNSTRGQLISGIVLGVGLGLLLSHLLFSPSHRNTANTLPEVRLNWQADGSPYFGETLSPGFSATAEAAPVFDMDLQLDEESDSEHPLKNALALETAPEVLHQTTNEQVPAPAPSRKGEPAPLRVSDAVPLGKNSEGEQETIRGIIDIELSHLPAEKRDVWFDALKDVKKEDVAGILRMWKLLGGPIPEVPLTQGFPTIPSLDSPQMKLPSPPDSTSPFLPDPEQRPGAAPLFGPTKPEKVSASAAALQEGAAILNEDQLLQNTHGHVTRVPFLTKNEKGEWLLQLRHEHFSDRRIKTGFPLDLAISGAGFFQLVDEDGIRFLTRRGHFTLDDEGRVSLKVGGKSYQLVPELRLPKDFQEPISSDAKMKQPTLQIDSEGSVAIVARRDGETVVPSKPGKIELVLPLSSEAIEHVGNGLFRVSESRTGEIVPVHTGSPGAATILAGYLELPALTDRTVLELFNE